MPRRTNTFEGGSSGTAITTANSGGTSGDAFSLVTVPAGGTATYDTGSAKNGTLGARLATGSAAGPFMQQPFTADTDFSIQGWWKFDATPAAAVQGPMLVRNSAGADLLRLTFNTSRRLLVTNGATNSTAAPAMTAATWYYLDWYGTGLNGTSGVFTLDIYNADASLFGTTGLTAQTTAALAGRAEWGTHSTVAGLVHRFDDVTADIAAGAGTAGGFPVATSSDYVRLSGAWVAYTPTVRRSGAWV